MPTYRMLEPHEYVQDGDSFCPRAWDTNDPANWSTVRDKHSCIGRQVNLVNRIHAWRRAAPVVPAFYRPLEPDEIVEATDQYCPSTLDAVDERNWRPVLSSGEAPDLAIGRRVDQCLGGFRFFRRKTANAIYDASAISLHASAHLTVRVELKKIEGGIETFSNQFEQNFSATSHEVNGFSADALQTKVLQDAQKYVTALRLSGYTVKATDNAGNEY